MDGSILTNIAALNQINSDYSTLASTSANISSELRQNANDLSTRIQNCLDDAIQKRIECEIKLQEAIQRQQEIASLGGDTPASAVSYTASLMFEAEIAIREAELLNAERIENDIRTIQSDYSNQISPLLYALEQGQQIVNDNRSRSGRFLRILIDVLTRAQAEADSMEQADHTSSQISVDSAQEVSRHYVVSDLSDTKDQLSNCSKDGEWQDEEAGKTAVTGGSLTKQNNANSGSNKSQRKYGDAQPVYGAFQQSQRILPNGDTLTTSGLNDHIVQSLIPNQGNNVFGYKNCCTLSTISNINTILGRNESESQVVFEAVARNLCITNYQIPEYNGGMGDAGIQTLLSDVYGVETTCKKAGSLSPEILGTYVEKGHIVTIGADSGLLWQGLPSGYADHQVLLTKVVRNSSTGKVEGFYMADTGAGRSDGNNIFVNVETMNKCFFGNRGPFGGVRNATAIISQKQLIL